VLRLSASFYTKHKKKTHHIPDGTIRVLIFFFFFFNFAELIKTKKKKTGLMGKHSTDEISVFDLWFCLLGFATFFSSSCIGYCSWAVWRSDKDAEPRPHRNRRRQKYTRLSTHPSVRQILNHVRIVWLASSNGTVSGESKKEMPSTSLAVLAVL
jgi:hypothetical protein